MKIPVVVLLLCVTSVAFLSSGCASIMSGPNQTVSVKSNPAGAKATFYNEKGVAVASCNTPATVTLKRRHDYVLTVEKEQFAPFETPVSGGLNGWYVGNVLLGGLIGFVIVDPLTGAMWSLSPDDVNVELASIDSGKNSVLAAGETPKVARKSGVMTPAEHRELQNNYSNFGRRSAEER